MTAPARIASDSRHALRLTFFWTLLVLFGLQIWRPFYFLTDDNLSYSLPLIAGIGTRLGHGRSPFVNDFLFGGNYNLFHDAGSLCEWNPVVLGFSLLANTRFSPAIIDLCASTYLLAGALTFAVLLAYLRELYDLQLSDRRLVFLSLSYTFSAFALQTGASWFMFLANQAALPLLLLGFFHRRGGMGVGLIALGIVVSLLMGHLSPLLWTLFFLSIFAAAWGLVRRSSEPLVRWGLGVVLGLVLISPLLWGAVQGFTGSGRSGALSVGAASSNAMSTPLLLASLWGGYLGVTFTVQILSLSYLPTLMALPSCVASWLMFQPSTRREPGNQTTSAPRPTAPLEWLMIGLMLLLVLLISRPHWLGILISHLPLYRSLRWPFREVLIFLFFFHVWLALRPVALPRVNLGLLILGSIFFLAPLLSLAAPSFNPMRLDRAILLSGQASGYWKAVKSHLRPGDRILPVADRQVLWGHKTYPNVPFTLLGAYNYPALFGVRSVSGYAASGLSPAALGGLQPNHWSGTYSPADAARLLKRDPHLKAIQLVSLRPLRLELRSAKSRVVLPLPPFLRR